MKRIIAFTFLAVVIIVAVLWGDGKVYTPYWEANMLTLTDTLRGIDTGRVATVDTTTNADSVIIVVMAGPSDARARTWTTMIPDTGYIKFDSTGKTKTVAIQWIDGDSTLTVVKPATGAKWVGWKYTIWSTITSERYGVYGGDETTIWDTSDVMQIAPANSYFVQFACFRMTEKDCTGARMILQNRMYVDSRPGDNWVNVCSSGVFTDTTAPLADTAKLTLDNLGEAFRVISWCVDSESAVNAYGQTEWFGLTCHIVARY